MSNTDAAFVGSVPELYTRYMGSMFSNPTLRIWEPLEGHDLRQIVGDGLRHRDPHARTRRCVAGIGGDHRHRPQRADARFRQTAISIT